LRRSTAASATTKLATSGTRAQASQYIPRTLRYARANLHKYPRFARLRELLAAHIEELA